MRSEQFPEEQSRLALSPIIDAEVTSVRPALELLTRSRVLIAVGIHLNIAQALLEITVSKTIDGAGTVLPQYWWEVDKLTEDEQGQPRRQKRWGMSLRSLETAEASYLAAREWVQTQTAPTR